MTRPDAAAVARTRAMVMEELRRLLPGRVEVARKTLPFGLAALDSHFPDGGLPCGALHEVVPAAAAAVPAAFGFIAAILVCSPPPSGPRLRAPEGGREQMARSAHPLLFVLPAYGLHPCSPHSRLYGHGLAALGLDPARLLLVETANRKETLWAMEEGLRSAAPAAVVGAIDKLDLKSSQRLQLAAADAGLPLFLLRPASLAYGGEASAAATRWRVGPAKAARDRFGLYARPRWHLQLERCRNGWPGEWVVEYDHVAHRFSLAAALADPAVPRSAGEEHRATACRA